MYIQKKFNAYINLDRRWKYIIAGTLLLICFPTFGELFFLLALIEIWRRDFKEIIRNSLSWLMGSLALWLLISSIFAYKPAEAFLGVANFIPFATLFLAFQREIREAEKLILVAWLLVLPAIPVVILGMGQLFFHWQSPEFLHPLLGWTLRLNGVPEGRMSSVFIYANLLAIYLLVVSILTLGLWMIAYQIWRSALRQEYFYQLVLLTTALILELIGLILTNSRNGWAIAILAGFVFALYLRWHWLVGVIASFAAGIAWASFGNLPGRDLVRQIVPSYVWKRLSDEMFANRPLATLRVTQWRFCLKMIGDRPLFGWGLRNFSPLYKETTNTYLGHPHNLWLMLASETGIVGLSLLMASVAIVFWQAIKGLNYLRQANKPQEHLILFTYLLAFSSLTAFNLSDVTIFDLRANTLGWLLLACIYGTSQSSGEIHNS